MRPALVLLGSLIATAITLSACGDTRHIAPRSVVLIVVDTLRADHLGLYGYDRPTSPELDRWSERAAVFERATATSPWTLPSMGSLYTGQLPTRHLAGAIVEVDGVDRYLGLSPSSPTLAERFSKAGLRTGAVVGNPYLHPSFGMARGFADYDYVEVDNREIRRADASVDRAIAWIEDRGDEPYFLLLHLFDPHMDYDPAPSARGRFTRELADGGELPITDTFGLRERARRGEADGGLSEVERAFLTAAYDEEVLACDREIGRLLDWLDARGTLDEGLVLLTSDHGEEFFEHGGFEHGHTLYREVLHVPFLVWGAGVRPGRHPIPVSGVDVAPTLLDALEISVENAPEAFEGRSLWATARLGTTLPLVDVIAEMTLYGAQERMIERWPDKLVIGADGGNARLFDVASDPHERQSLAGIESERVRVMTRELERVLSRAESRREARSQIVLGELDLERLRALGYLDSMDEAPSQRAGR